MSTIDEIRRVRLEKSESLKKLGLNPYPAQSQKDKNNFEVVQNFEKYQGSELHLCGRIMSLRRQGGLTFCHITDQSGSIQVFIRRQDLSPTSTKTQTLGYEDLKLLDIGDFIEVFGKIDKSSTGEVSLFAKDIKILTKTLRPLPEKWSGIKDQETIYRRRYLDLIMNPDRKNLFIRKSKFWDLNRQFLKEKGFLEVETPIMELVTGGADAKPFITHHNALDQDFYLRISTELYQKRLIGGGFEKIFTLGPNFRNEGIDDEHLQEYYQCEWYWAYADYRHNMDLVEEMFKYIAKSLYGKSTFTKENHTFNLDQPWPRRSFSDLIKERFEVDIFNDSEEKILSIIKSQKIDTSGLNNRGRIVDNLWKIIRREISGPIFVIDEPVFSSPLAKSRSDNPELTERFHVIIAGSELGNGYSELNDPLDQYQRFLDQQKNRDAGDEESQMMDIDYVEMLEWGMPPTSGYAHSERLFWFLENVTAREATFFPQMKFDITDETRRIYNLPKPSLSEKKSENISSKNKTESNLVYQIDDNLLSDYPEISTGIAILKNVSITKENNELEKEKFLIEQKYHGVQIDDVSSIPTIKSYRDFFRKFGVDPASHHPSPDALLRRVVSGKGLYKINTLVDAYNVACLESNLGMSAMNLDKISLPLELRYSNEGEKVTLLGGDETKTTKSHQVVYADQQGIVTLDLNYRDCDRTKITEKTKNVLLTVDGAPGISDEDIEKALTRQIELIQKYCGGDLVLKHVGKQAKSVEEKTVGLKNDKIIIGKIVEMSSHPNADKLHVLKVDIGTEVLDIVCGADNIKVGDLVPVAQIGAAVFDESHQPVEIGKAKLRGVESNGMLCSTRELGLGPEHDGIYLLDDSLSPLLGHPVNEYLAL